MKKATDSGDVFMVMIKEVKDTINNNHKEVKVELNEIKDTLKKHQLDYIEFKTNTCNNINNHDAKINYLEQEVNEIKTEEINQDKDKLKWYKSIAFKIVIGIIVTVLSALGFVKLSDIFSVLL